MEINWDDPRNTSTIKLNLSESGENARQTIIERYDLNRVCFSEQLKLLEQ